MTLFSKFSLRRASGSPDERASPPDRLLAEVSALENELAESVRALAGVEARATAAESHAMDAIRSGDDRAARAFLVEQQAYAEKAAAVRADLDVLRAILDECHQLASKLSDSASRRP